MKPPRPFRSLAVLPLAAALAAPAAADHDPLDTHDDLASAAPTSITGTACTDAVRDTHDLGFASPTPSSTTLAYAGYSLPPTAPSVLVVIGHGSTHTVESWREHMLNLTDDYGVLAVALEYGGGARPGSAPGAPAMQRGSNHVVDHEGVTRLDMPRAFHWPQKAGGEDLIAAAKRFQADCPSIQKTILVGVSMGVAMSGYAVSHLPSGDEGLFDVWVACEGVHDMLETYHEAKGADPTVAGWMELETGGTPDSAPTEYQERTNLLKTAAIESAGLERVVYLHAAYDGLVGYHQSRQMSRQLQVPFEFYTVTLRGNGDAGTTLPDHVPGDPFPLRPDENLAGHAGEWDPDSLLMRATFERIGAVALGVPTNCGEYHAQEGAVEGDVDFVPTATYPCTLVGNDAPDALDDSDATLPGVPVTIDVQANDSDPDNDPLTTVAATAGEKGVAVVELDGTITYNPLDNFDAFGDSFEYTVADGTGNSDTATVFVPEPGRGALLGAGLVAVALLGARRRRA